MALPFVLALLTGCDPHDATVTGNYAMYFAEATSDNILRLKQQYAPSECAYTQNDPRAPDIDSSQIFADDCWTEKKDAEAQFQKDYNLTPIDCRTFGSSPYNDNPIRIRDTMVPGWEDEYEQYCCVESRDADPANDPDGDVFTTDDCHVETGHFMNWLDDKAYYLNTDKVESYREEAVLTSEGDLQLTVHTSTPFGDVRFGWVVKPDYAPTQCATVDGKTEEQPLFGDADVVQNWSATEDGGTLFYLNAGAFQVNPNNTGDYWFFDHKWDAAYGFSRFGDEDAYLYATDYQEYVDTAGAYVPYWVATGDNGAVVGGYDNAELATYHELNCGEGDDTCAIETYPDFVESMKDNFINGGTDADGNTVAPAQDDLANYGRLPQDTFPFNVKIEDNGWREIDPGKGTDGTGFANWVGVNPSWVHLDNSLDDLKAVEPGTQDKPITGEFQIYLTSADTSGSVWFFHGKFEITTVERDTWGYSPELDDIKREENATPVCGD